MATPLRLERMLIRVSGSDALSFLQGVLTQDVERLANAGILYAALLTPQGKVIADMLLWADGEDVFLDIDPARGRDLMARLSMYKLRAQVKLEVSQCGVVWSEAAFAGALPDPRLQGLGWRKLEPASDVRALTDGADAYQACRIALGAPDLAIDAAPEEAFALEALLEELNGVDFQKGCFVGQENVSRMKRRATARRKFCPIVFEGPAVAPGTPILAGETDIGGVRTGRAGRALAFVRLDRAIAAREGLTANGRQVRLDPPPWLLMPPRDGAAD